MRTSHYTTPRNESGVSFDLSDQDLADIHDIMKVGKLAWDPKKREMAWDYDDVPVFRIFTQYLPETLTNINPQLAGQRWFPLQPLFFRAVVGTGNLKLFELFKMLTRESIELYGKPFSTVSCLLTDTDVPKHVHSIDPNKPIITTTYYYDLTNRPLDCTFFAHEDGDEDVTEYPMHRHGVLNFNSSRWHGVNCIDKNMRFFVLIDSV